MSRSAIPRPAPFRHLGVRTASCDRQPPIQSPGQFPDRVHKILAERVTHATAELASPIPDILHGPASSQQPVDPPASGCRGSQSLDRFMRCYRPCPTPSATLAACPRSTSSKSWTHPIQSGAAARTRTPSGSAPRASSRPGRGPPAITSFPAAGSRLRRGRTRRLRHARLNTWGMG